MKNGDVFDLSTDEGPTSEEGGDTDEEVEKVKARQKQLQDAPAPSLQKKETSKSPAKLNVGSDGLPVLPTFFDSNRFFLYGNFSAVERKELKRFIVAFEGTVEEYVGDTVTHVVTKVSWNKDFDDALEENKNLFFVKPEWIRECGRLSELVDVTNYLIDRTK